MIGIIKSAIMITEATPHAFADGISKAKIATNK